MQAIHLSITPHWLKSSAEFRGRKRFCAAAASRGGSNPSPDEQQQVDWDEAWKSTMQKKKKGRPLFDFNMEQYVSRNPTYRNFPESEEIDELRKVEKSNLSAWNDPKFTLAGFGVILGLFVYMIMNAPPHA